MKPYVYNSVYRNVLQGVFVNGFRQAVYTLVGEINIMEKGQVYEGEEVRTAL